MTTFRKNTWKTLHVWKRETVGTIENYHDACIFEVYCRDIEDKAAREGMTCLAYVNKYKPDWESFRQANM